GAVLADLAAAGDRGAAVEVMARGAGEVLRRLHEEGKLDGVLGMGGSGGSSLISQAMRVLPVGIPKLLVSTMASGDTRPYVGTSDISMMYSVVDIAGINEISERILSNAAAAIAGMANAHADYHPKVGAKPLIGATMFGVTTACVTAAREWLEDHGYEVLVFHATGTGGMSMEALMASGYITGALDITTTELADELVGGVLSAGPARLEMAGSLGIPQVVSLGALDMGNFGPIDSVPEKFQARNLYKHNPTVTLMRTTAAECAELGRIIAAKLNAAGGPLTLFIPLRGVSAISTEGGVFHDPEADAALIGALREGLDESVDVVEMDTDINDPAFAVAMAQRLDAHYRAWSAAHGKGDGR
ncbi:MAG: Tm-1-like ATP-binding domain-containing protein, partial [Acidimicrobiia bacterium]